MAEVGEGEMGGGEMTAEPRTDEPAHGLLALFRRLGRQDFKTLVGDYPGDAVLRDARAVTRHVGRLRSRRLRGH
jgi:hypothetical protein